MSKQKIMYERLIGCACAAVWHHLCNVEASMVILLFVIFGVVSSAL
jgi:hypothetical protein